MPMFPSCWFCHFNIFCRKRREELSKGEKVFFRPECEPRNRHSTNHDAISSAKVKIASITLKVSCLRCGFSFSICCIIFFFQWWFATGFDLLAQHNYYYIINLASMNAIEIIIENDRNLDALQYWMPSGNRTENDKIIENRWIGIDHAIILIDPRSLPIESYYKRVSRWFAVLFVLLFDYIVPKKRKNGYSVVVFSSWQNPPTPDSVNLMCFMSRLN